MYNLKNTKIDFVSAQDGKVFLWYTENGVRKEKGSENPIILADIMSKLGNILIDVHSQNNNLSLLDNNFKYMILDSIANIEKCLYTSEWIVWLLNGKISLSNSCSFIFINYKELSKD